MNLAFLRKERQKIDKILRTTVEFNELVDNPALLQKRLKEVNAREDRSTQEMRAKKRISLLIKTNERHTTRSDLSAISARRMTIDPTPMSVFEVQRHEAASIFQKATMANLGSDEIAKE